MNPSVEYERQRIMQRADSLLEGVFNADRFPSDAQNVRIDHIAIISIVTWDNSEGDTFEAPVFDFDTKRYHVQVGMVNAVMQQLMGRFGTGGR